MADLELIARIKAGRKLASRDEEFDRALIREVVSLPDPLSRLKRLEQMIEASREVDGWSSDVLTNARVYVLFGQIPPEDFV